jgi:3-oxoacyl-(acyl-carrier-protein) synthase
MARPAMVNAVEDAGLIPDDVGISTLTAHRRRQTTNGTAIRTYGAAADTVPVSRRSMTGHILGEPAQWAVACIMALRDRSAPTINYEPDRNVISTMSPT